MTPAPSLSVAEREARSLGATYSFWHFEAKRAEPTFVNEVAYPTFGLTTSDRGADPSGRLFHDRGQVRSSRCFQDGAHGSRWGEAVAENILCLNAGSSSLKFALFALAQNDRLDHIGKGEIEGIGALPRLCVAEADGRARVVREWPQGAALGHGDFLGEILGWAESRRGTGRIAAVGHRIVHGGMAFRAPVVIDPQVLAKLDHLVPLAPLHQRHNLAAIRRLAVLRPELVQVACLDTSFPHSLMSVAARFALPREFEASGVRRYV